ncbi:MAG: response regulator transcription factor [Candidatus Dormibacteraeota bacterium]|nr:response regulator transcription factor [Candidatus Dormibacteraeota bacterium]
MLVEDHNVVAEALEAYLEAGEEIQVVGRAENVADAVRMAARKRPDVVLMDFYLPDGSGADAARAILAEHDGVAVVFLTADEGEETLLAAVEAGAKGYVNKTASGTDIIDSIHRAASGEMLIPAARLAELVGRQRELAQEREEHGRIRGVLTPREMEVLAAMASGTDSHGIAEQLGISFTTVRTHTQSVLEKLGVHSKLEAVRRAEELGLV